MRQYIGKPSGKLLAVLASASVYFGLPRIMHRLSFRQIENSMSFGKLMRESLYIQLFIL